MRCVWPDQIYDGGTFLRDSKFEYLSGSLNETNLKKVHVTTITILALGASLALTIY